MKTLLNKIYLHPLFLLLTFLFVLLGRFRLILYFMLLIIVHELGHILTGLLFKWKIDKVVILPFGCLTKFNIDINTSLFSEFIVSISGIIFQLFFYIIISKYITYYYFSFINYFIIVFNMLPIIPLDGSKILNVILNKITSFYNAICISSIISFITIVVINVLVFKYNKLIVLVTIFLFIETVKYYKNIEYIFNRFLLERYMKKYYFKRYKTIDNVYKMKKDYKHIFLLNNKCITENTFLSKMFDFKGKV